MFLKVYLKEMIFIISILLILINSSVYCDDKNENKQDLTLQYMSLNKQKPSVWYKLCDESTINGVFNYDESIIDEFFNCFGKPKEVIENN